MSSIKIDKNVPMPWGDKFAYPLKKSKIGESFAVSVEETKKIRNAITATRKVHKRMKFVTRTENNGKIRIWRFK